MSESLRLNNVACTVLRNCMNIHTYFDVAIDNEYSIQLRNLPTGL